MSSGTEVLRDAELMSLVRVAEGHRVTAADVVLGTGCSVVEAETALSALMCDAGGEFVIRGDGDKAVVEFVFPKDFEARSRRKIRRYRMMENWEALKVAVGAFVKASAGVVLLVSLGVAALTLLLVALVAIVAASSQRGGGSSSSSGHRPRLMPLRSFPMMHVGHDMNDFIMFYWLFGGGNPFFQPIYGFPRLWMRPYYHRQQQQQRYWRTSRDDDPEETHDVVEEKSSDDDDDEEEVSPVARVATAMYTFLFGDSSSGGEKLWRYTAGAILRRNFIVVPEDLASWLPEPPLSLAKANASSALAIARFGGNSVVCPDVGGFLVDFTQSLGRRQRQQIISDSDDYLKETRRTLFPKKNFSDTDFNACLLTVSLNFLLWLTVRFVALPGITIPTKNKPPAPKSLLEEEENINQLAALNGIIELLRLFLTSRFVFGLANFFLLFAIIFGLLPCLRNLFFVLIPNRYIDHRNNRRKLLRDRLREALQDPNAPVSRKFNHADTLRKNKDTTPS